MADRELVELAAKAAGYEVAWNPHWNCLQHRYPQPDAAGRTRHPWVPLDDDGDALRLAAKLELDVMHRVVGRKRIEVLPAGGPLFQYPYEGMDTAAAWRNAIVRAAAEIGKAMP